MSNLILLDEKFEDYRVVDEYVSLIWTTRFREPGDFELQVPASQQNIEDYIPDRYLFSTDFYVKTDTQEYAHLMIIETVELSENVLKITGRSLKSILERRIIWGRDTIKAYEKFTGTVFEQGVDYFEYAGGRYDKTTDASPVSGKEYYTHTKVENAIKQVINFNIIVPPDGTYPENYPGDYRRIPNFVLGDFTGYNWGVIEEEIQYDGTTVLEVVNDICSKSTVTEAVGYTVVYNFVTNKIEFRLYKPVDRSLEQYDKDPIIFSEQFNEMKSSKYIESTVNYKNVAYVSGEKYSDDEIDKFHQVAVVGIPNSMALYRRELFVDATSMQHELDDGTIYSTATYQDMLVQKGNTELNKKENRYSRVFEGEVDFNQIGYIFGTDYDIGDIVEITNRYNVNKRLRVVEVVLSLSTSGNTMVPGFEDVDTPETALEYGAVQGGTEHIAYLTEEMLGTIIGDQTSSANQAINQIIDLKDLAYASDLRRTDQALTSEIQARSNGDTVLESAIKQTAHTISMTVSQPGGENTSAGITISLLDEDGNLLNNATGTINLNGIVTFTNNNYADKTELPDLVEDKMDDVLDDYPTESELAAGTTTINGGCITTGMINAALIKTGILSMTNQSTGYNFSINLNAGTMSWDLPNSKMDSNGRITIHATGDESTSVSDVTNAGIVLDYPQYYGSMSLNNDRTSLSYKSLIVGSFPDLSSGRHWVQVLSDQIILVDKSNSNNKVVITPTSIQVGVLSRSNVAIGLGSISINGYDVATQYWVGQQGYLTSHQSLSGYATEDWVRRQGYLTSHQSLSGYATQTWSNNKFVELSGDTMTGNLTISNGSSQAQVSLTNNSGTIRLSMNTGSNADRGLYDSSNSNWIIKHARTTIGGSTRWVPCLPTAGAATTTASVSAVLTDAGYLCKYSGSSKRFKNHITYIDENDEMYLETVKAARDFRTVIYKYNNGYVGEDEASYYRMGFIAEDLDSSIGSYVVQYDEEDQNVPDHWDVYPLVSIITVLAQDNAKRLDEKDKEIAELKDRIETLEKLVNQLLPEEVRK